MSTSTLFPFRDINVHASPSHYAFSSPSSPNAPSLVIERPNGDIRLAEGTLRGSQRVSSIAGILGIISLKLDKYIIVITKAQPMGKIKGHMTYKVVATEFLPLRERPLHDKDEDTYRDLLNMILKSPIYFSYTLDLTNSFQRQAKADVSQPLWKRADDRFFWNRYLQTDLIDFRNGIVSKTRLPGKEQVGVDNYILPVMFGMLRIAQTTVKGTPLTFTLITRRSRFRAGTRYFSRGVDENGNVANYNESEQIVILNDVSETFTGFSGGSAKEGKELQVMSFVQTRGSVPVFWAEINTLKYTPTLQVKPVETSVAASKKHFEEQIRIYGDNYLVNLVNQKGREKRVKDAYEQIVRIVLSNPEEGRSADHKTSEQLKVVEPASKSNRNPFDKLHYTYFDFHNETKGLKWHRALLLLDQLKDGLNKGSYFRGVDMPGDTTGRLEARSLQTAVVRTNCMDSLDRTNVVQTMLGRYTLTRQLIDAGVLREGESADDDAMFAHFFRNIWADNADVVSNSYSGTGALKTDFTRTGNRTRQGALKDLNNSITRYVRNNFLDGPRQDAFDLFHGVYHPRDSAGQSMVFADRRPLEIQAVPYVLAFTVFFTLVALGTPRSAESFVWPLRLFVLLAVGIAVWSARFIVTHGALYVNWPKLSTPRFAVEGYSTSLAKAKKDVVIGELVKRHERGQSVARLGNAEEGKKRIQ